MTATVLNINNKGRFMLKHAPVPSRPVRPLTPTTAPTLPPKAGAVQGRLPDVGSLPDQDEKKTKIRAVRLDEQDDQFVQREAASTRVSGSEWIRDLIGQRKAMVLSGQGKQGLRHPILTALDKLKDDVERFMKDERMSRSELIRATEDVADLMREMFPKDRRRRA